MVKLKYIFIDESGDLGFSLKSSRFFIISALIVGDPFQIDRIIKNMRRNKFKKELSSINEIKANKSSPQIRKYLLEKINSISDIKIFHVVLEKNKVKSNFLKNNKHKLYNFIAGELAKNIIMNDIDFEIRIDKSKGKIFLINDFDLYFKKQFYKNSKNIGCQIFHSYSHNFSGLQLVDFIVWSIYQKFERNNPTYNEIIKVKQELYLVWNKTDPISTKSSTSRYSDL